MTPDDDDDRTRILPPGAAATPPASGGDAGGAGAAGGDAAWGEDGDATVIRPPRGAPPAASARPVAETGASAPSLDARAQATPQPAPPATPQPTAERAHDEGGNMLPVGTRLGEFEVTQVLGEGGFGIVYLAQDTSLGRRVALKEYMPSSLAQRTGRTQVSVKSERYRETFEAGLKSFVNEARLLAQFDHPSLVKVYRFWEANGTAYMVMPFYEGVTLKDELRAMGQPPDEAWLRALLDPLSEALAVIHAEQCFHRDIAPDNVILLKGSRRPLLLDFGAARRVIGDMTQALTVILKPGYAPVEQYAEVPGMKQGPWTDVYALAAVVYYAITGKTPPTSVGRLMNDNYQPLAQVAAGRYDAGFLATMDRALKVRPDERTPSIDVFRAELGFAPADVDQADHTVRRTGPAPLAARSGAAPAAPAGGRRTALVAGGAVVALAALAVGGWALFGRSAPTATTAQAPASVPSAPSASAPVPATAAAPVVADAASAVAPPEPATTPAPAATTPGRFDAAREFERVAAAQSPDHVVEAAADKPSLRVGRDKLTFKVKSEKGGYLYVFYAGTDGSIAQLYPNRAATRNLMRPGTTVSLPPPDGKWDLSADGPPGTQHLLALVSSHPRDFRGVGLQERDGFFQGTAQGVGELLRTRAAGAPPLFAGKADCKEPCTDDYGAALFTVDVTN